VVSRIVRLTLVVVWLAACSSAPVVQAPVDVPAGDPLLGSPSESLWRQAVVAREQGELAAAGRLLERAVTLVPDSSWLYRELAELRLREDQPRAAEGLARKALRFAPPTGAYRAALWQLVATACARSDDPDCVALARREARVAQKGARQ
jgi:predicted Zn-dependent protease